MDIQNGEYTQINPNSVTVVNPTQSSPTGSSTTINPSAQPIGSVTTVNPSLNSEVGDKVKPQARNSLHEANKNLGQIIDGYRLISVIGSSSGEADLYICEDGDSNTFCLKHYKRLDSVSEEVHTVLQSLNAPYVAKLISWGYWDERIYEIWPFFSKGSLMGHRPDDELLLKYINQMNTAIFAIHQRSIIHQDIKPDNFMIDDLGNIALIDFGTSTIMGKGVDQRTYVTTIGHTTDYSAPEVLFSRYCWPASDYYSLGVTIYELLLGVTPYSNYDENMLQRKFDDMRDGRIPGLDKLAPKYRDLITGLLWYDREERWGYTQVCDWLNGKWTALVPPFQRENQSHKHEKQFRFDGTIYWIPSQMSQLIVNMAYQWDMGKNLFDMDGRFIRMCKTLEDMEGTEDLYALCNAPKATRSEDNDINYFKKLYKLSPSLNFFAWRNWHFENKKALGEAILNALWASEIDKTASQKIFSSDIFGKDTSENSFPSRDEIAYWARNHIISMYLDFTGDSPLAGTVLSLEKVAQNDTLSLFRIAYLLSDSSELRLPSGRFRNKNEFLQFVEEKAKGCGTSGSVDAFLDFCRSEIYDGHAMNAGFQAWVENLGLAETLKILTDEDYQKFADEYLQKNAMETESRPSVDAPGYVAKPASKAGVVIRESRFRSIECPVCGGRFSAGSSSTGKHAHCPYCDSDFDMN